MRKQVRLVVSSRKGVTLFLAHGKSTPKYRAGIKQQVALGRGVIASDEVAEVLSKEGVDVIPFSKYSTHLELLREIKMKPVLPEALIIGMTADISDPEVRAQLESSGIPVIDHMVIDPSYLVAKRDDIMGKVKDEIPVSLEEVIEGITPTVYTAVPSAIKAGRIVIMTEEDLTEMNEKIESGAFEDIGFTEKFFVEMTKKAWSKFFAKPIYYIGKALEGKHVKETAQA